MRILNFWGKWQKPYKIIYRILLLLFFMAIVFALISSVWGDEWVLGWEILKTYRPLTAPIATVEMVFSTVPVDVEHYMVVATFQGSELHISPQLYAALAILSILSLSTLISIITALSRFWYYFGMIVIAFALVAMRFEQLMLLGMTENIGLFLAILLYFPLSYYFQFIKKHTSFYKRIVWFFIASLLFMFILGLFSHVHIPFVYLGSYGIIFPLALLFLFIFFVAHDILSGFLYIITNGSTLNNKNSLLHFVVISGLYLGWVFLTYLHNTNYIDWDILYLNATWLLVISAVLGIWGFRNRSEYVFSFLPFAPFGAFLYLTLGIMGFVALGAFHLLGNYPMLEMIEDAIIFAHLGIGFMFFIYIIGNFGGLLARNLNVFKVQYKPLNLPYFTATIGGLVLVGVFVARSQLFPYFQGFAGYYNGLGDLFVADKQLFLGEQYYKLARSYDARNQRSNYALAAMARKQGDEALALKYFDDALLKKPSEQVYINIAHIYESKGRFFDALFTLKKGLAKFPKSARIKNNLGVLFSQTSVIDSALLYLGEAALDGKVENSAEVNLLYLLGEARLSTDFDSLAENFQSLPSLLLKNNTLVNLNIRQLPLTALSPKEIPVAQQNLDAETFAFWYEYALNQAFNEDAAQLAPTLDSIAKDSLNALFHSELTFALANYHYYHYRVRAAFLALEDLAISSSRAGYYYNMLGLWALEQEAYQLAAGYFKQAENEGHDNVAFPMAVALSALGKEMEALPYWEALQKHGNQSQQRTAKLMQALFKPETETETDNPSDSLLFLKIKFSSPKEIPSLLRLASALSDGRLQWKAWLSILDKALENGYYTGMKGLLEMLDEKPLDKKQKEHLNKLKLTYWLKTDQLSAIGQWLKDSMDNTASYEVPELVLYQAKTAFAQGKKEEAKKKFSLLADLNPFFEEGIIAAAQFYQIEVKDENAAYKFLLNALDTNPYSLSLQKAYILQCLNMRLISYAENGMSTLKEMAPPEDFEAFSHLYNAKQDSLQQAHSQWE